MSDPGNRAAALARLLAWSKAMGADAALSDEATDWVAHGSVAPGANFVMPGADGLADSSERQTAAALRQSKDPGGSVPPQRAVTPSPVQVRHTVAAPSAPPKASRSAQVEAASLEELEAKLRAFDGCGLKTTATNLCFFRGAPKARLLVIGEAPGRDEDLEGRPFVGRAGQLLDKMLAAIGLDETSVHITNIVYWRPPGNRTPSPQEALACRPFLDRQAVLVEPEILLLVGGSAAKHILETDDGIMRLRGRWLEASMGGRRLKTMATLHPAYLLRSPAAKRQVWRDLLAVKDSLK